MKKKSKIFVASLRNSIEIFLSSKNFEAIKKIDQSIMGASHQTQNEYDVQDDDWSQECLEYLFENKIWHPGIVRSESLIIIVR